MKKGQQDEIIRLGRAAFAALGDADPCTAGAALDIARTLLAHRQHEVVDAAFSGASLASESL